MIKSFKIIVLFLFLTFPFLLQAQYLYYSNRSLFPLSVSNNRLTVKFKQNVPATQKASYLQNLSQIDPVKAKRGLPGNFVGLPLIAGVNVSRFIQTLKNSNLFEAVFPVYRTKEQEEILMYDEFVVRFKPTVSSNEIKAFSSRHKVEIVKINDAEPTQYTFRWTPGADVNPLIMSNMFFDSLDCVWASPDFVIQGSFFDVIPNDLYFSNQYYLHNTGQEPIPGEGPGVPDTDIDAPEAWELSLGSTNIVVAVIDEGVMSHPDLPASRILPGYDYAGYYQYNPYHPNSDPDSDPSPDGNEAHGMAVAGIIAASHNSIGIAGIVPNSKILPVKIFDFHGFMPERSKVAEAVDFAWKNGADVINGSWGYYIDDPNNPLYTQIRDAVIRAMTKGRDPDGDGPLPPKGTVCVFAAGNGGGTQYYDFVGFPANIPGVLAVGAIDKSNNIWYYSPKDTRIDIVTPSGNTANGPVGDLRLRGDVWSIEIPGEPGWNPGNYRISPPWYYIAYETTPDPKGDNYPPGNYTARFGGTSAAAPQAAGVAALILSVNPDLFQSDVVNIIKNSAVDIGLPEEDQGSGRLNAYNALTYTPPPPAIPQNFQVTQQSLGGTYRPKLTWDANTEPDLAGYLIERKIDNGTWEIPMNGNVSKDATSFLDYEIVIWNNSNFQTAYYRMRAYNNYNIYSDYTQIISIDFHIMFKPLLTQENIPKVYELSQNYPNPFNPSTDISYSIKEDGIVVIKVFDVLGKKVAVLKNKYETAGKHIINFNAANLPSGIYYYTIKAGSFHQTKKMVLLK